MTPTFYVIVVGGAAAQISAEPHLESWAAARHARLEFPTQAQRPAAGSSDGVGTRAEALLEQARVALGTLDDAAVSEKLEAVDRLLRDTPALPQAAWLMAERYALAYALLSRSASADAAANTDDATSTGGAAQKMLRARVVLEGMRAPALGESPPRISRPASDVQVVLRGHRETDQVFWNGVERTPPLRVPSGEHHVRILREGRIAFAGWVTLSEKERSLVIPASAPCSSADLAGAQISAGKALPAAGTSCPRYVVVQSTALGIDVATCSGASCGPLLPWRQGAGSVFDGPPQPKEAAPFPTWVAIGTGVGAAILTTIVLWNTGVFEERKPGRTRFVFTGPNQSETARPGFSF